MNQISETKIKGYQAGRNIKIMINMTIDKKLQRETDLKKEPKTILKSYDKRMTPKNENKY